MSNKENNIVDQLGGAAVRIINLIGKTVEIGSASYNEFKSSGKDKELYSKVSTEANTIISKVKEKLGNK